jgi:hypothetical protein
MCAARIQASHMVPIGARVAQPPQSNVNFSP